MIVIVASRWDTVAENAATDWAGQPVGIMTARDLSRAGWCVRQGACDASTANHCAVIDGRAIADDEITGVLTRLSWITEAELPEIVERDRAYVAAEMNAFLVFWLSGLTCPVLNNPTPTCLSGPGWRPERWTRAAAEIGMPVHAVERDTRPHRAQPPTDSSTYAVTVVGSQVFGAVDAELKRHARRLAELAGVSLLTVRFAERERGAAFAGTDLFPPLDDAAVRAAVLEHLAASPRIAA
jgi:hypothetical protein